MKDNELPSFADLGVNVEDLLKDDPITKAEEFFNDFVDIHFDDLPEDILRKITLDAGNFVDDDEPIDIEDFKGSLLMAFTINDDGIESPEEYIKKVFGGDK